MVKRLLKASAVVVVFGALLALAFTVGDENHKATPIGWVSAVAVAAMIAMDALYSAASRRALLFEMKGGAEECLRGETIDMKAVFKNKSLFVLQSVQGELSMRDGTGSALLHKSIMLSLGPFAERAIDIPVTFDDIGSFEVQVSDVRVGDMLGLFSSKASRSTSTRIRVIPRISRIEGIGVSEDAMLESKHVAKSVLADSQDYAYVRDYVIGDPLKSIHWKLSARLGSYYTRLYEMSTNPGLVVIVDFFVPTTDAKESHQLLNAVVEAGISAASWAKSNGLDIELRYVDKLGEAVVTAKCDSAAWRSLIDDMPENVSDASLRAAAIDLVRNMIAERAGHNNVLVCSSNLGDEMMSTIDSIRADHRFPVFLGAIPSSLVDRAKEEYCQNLFMLEGAGISYLVFSDSSDLAGVEIR